MEKFKLVLLFLCITLSVLVISHITGVCCPTSCENRKWFPLFSNIHFFKLKKKFLG